MRPAWARGRDRLATSSARAVSALLRSSAFQIDFSCLPMRFSGLGVGRVVDGVPGQMELAALPCGTAQNGAPGGAQAAVVIGDDEVDPAHAAGDETFEERPPVDLSLRQGHRHAPAPGGRSSGPMPMAESTATSRTIPPWRIFSYRASRMRYLISPSGRSRQACSSSSSSLAARLTCDEDRLSIPNSRHHGLDLPGGHALDVHLGDSQHDRSD